MGTRQWPAFSAKKSVLRPLTPLIPTAFAIAHEANYLAIEMNPAHVKAPPGRPLMVFDGDCQFCRFWIRRWQRLTGDHIEYLPFQDPRIAAQFPELPRSRFEQSVQFIEPDGTVYSGAEAVFRSLAVNPRWRFWLRLYEKVPGFRPLTESFYRFIANHRTTFSALTRFFMGRRTVELES